MENTRYRRVFITGALGFVGRTLAERYRRLGVEVRGLDLHADPEKDVIAGDVAAPEVWPASLQGCDLLIHTAAIVTNNVTTRTAWRVNVLGTRCVLEAARQAGVKRFVHFSSLAAMRYVEEDGADERAPVMPVGNPYVDTKIAGEHVVLAAHAAGGLETTIVRPADIYGPGSRPWTIVPVQMIKKGLFFLPAHGRGFFRALYIDDLVEGVVRAAESEAAAGNIFILGGEEPVTCERFFGHYYRMLGKGRRPPSLGTGAATVIAEAAHVLFTLMGKPTELGRGAIEMLSKKTTVSNAKAHEVLGWRPRVSLEEGMRRTEAWLRAEGMLD